MDGNAVVGKSVVSRRSMLTQQSRIDCSAMGHNTGAQRKIAPQPPQANNTTITGAGLQTWKTDPMPVAEELAL